MTKKQISKLTFNKSLTKVLTIGMMGIVSITSVFSAFAYSRRVDIICDGMELSINTSIQDTRSILEYQKIKVSDDDVIVRDDYPDENLVRILVKRAYNVPVIVDGKKVSSMLAGGNVRDAILKAGIYLNPNDQVVPPLNTSLFNGINIEVVRQKNVNFTFNGTENNLTVKDGTVGEMLEAMNITLADDDQINVGLEEGLYDGMNIVLDRINNTEETYQEEIPFETVTKKTDDLEEGTTQIESEGVKGTCEVKVSKKIVNGEVVETNVIDKKVVTEPKSEIKLVGTRKKQLNSISCGCATICNEDGKLIDHNGNPIYYSKKLSGPCTAYSASSGARTATGELAQFGKVAVDPRIIPYGTKLYICSDDGSFVYGYATASDTGSALKNGHTLVDLFYPSEGECISFGRRTLSIYFV